MLSNEIHHFAGAYCTLLRSAPTEELHAFATRVAKLERCAAAARIIVHEYSGESLFVEGFVSTVMMAELAEALKELEE